MKNKRMLVLMFVVCQLALKIVPAQAAASQKGETSHPTQKRTYTFE